ncbi:MAG: MCE family protein [Melioribacteraceae bacterium]|nr:MCE family protein [Melioribacteraceae bacterium]
MLKQLEGARLGLFIFIGTVLIVISIFLLGSKENLFSRTIEIKTFFNQVEGLKNGAPVRLSGYDIGSVSQISLSEDTTGYVEVKMNINVALKHFIRIDSRATVETEGLVGKKIITITPGSPDMPEVTNGSIIKSKEPVNIGKIIEETESVMSYMKDLTKEFSEIFAKVNKGDGTIGKLVNDEQLYRAAVSITRTADRSLDSITLRLNQVSDFLVSSGTNVDRIIQNVNFAVEDIQSIIKDVENGKGLLGMLVADQKLSDSVKTLVNNLTQTSAEANIAASRLAENMEALKHNWLFKTYFEQRGYWDKAEYQKEIDLQLDELRNQNKILDEKIIELMQLEKKYQKSN